MITASTGTSASLFFPTGTMAQQLALRVQLCGNCRSGISAVVKLVRELVKRAQAA